MIYLGENGEHKGREYVIPDISGCYSSQVNQVTFIWQHLSDITSHFVTHYAINRIDGLSHYTDLNGSQPGIGEASIENWGPVCLVRDVEGHLCWLFILLYVGPYLRKDIDNSSLSILTYISDSLVQVPMSPKRHSSRSHG